MPRRRSPRASGIHAALLVAGHRTSEAARWDQGRPRSCRFDRHVIRWNSGHREAEGEVKNVARAFYVGLTTALLLSWIWNAPTILMLIGFVAWANFGQLITAEPKADVKTQARAYYNGLGLVVITTALLLSRLCHVPFIFTLMVRGVGLLRASRHRGRRRARRMEQSRRNAAVPVERARGKRRDSRTPRRGHRARPLRPPSRRLGLRAKSPARISRRD